MLLHPKHYLELIKTRALKSIALTCRAIYEKLRRLEHYKTYSS